MTRGVYLAGSAVKDPSANEKKGESRKDEVIAESLAANISKTTSSGTP